MPVLPGGVERTKDALAFKAGAVVGSRLPLARSERALVELVMAAAARWAVDDLELCAKLVGAERAPDGGVFGAGSCEYAIGPRVEVLAQFQVP